MLPCPLAYHLVLQTFERLVGAAMPPTIHRHPSGQLTEIQEILDYRFKNLTLLEEALTHASGADHRLTSNERLEFLGDAILGAVVCELLFRKFPDYLEGDLTKVKSTVVSRRICARSRPSLGSSNSC